MFIKLWRAEYPLNTLCWVLEVSTSAYYSWQRRPLADHQVQDALLEQRIRELHQASKGRYGTPRLQADLRAEGQRVSRRRISRLMRRSGLRAKGPRRFVRTTDSDHLLAVCPNLLNREFNVQNANTVWASDLTFIPTREGWLYLAVTLNLHSRVVVGHAMDSQMPATLPLAALQMAVSVRTPPSGLLHHSDRGSQYVRRLRPVPHIPRDQHKNGPLCQRYFFRVPPDPDVTKDLRMKSGHSPDQVTVCPS